MDERQYFISLSSEAVLRVGYTKDAGRILRFVVQLEAYIESEWTPITRYDNAHHFVHRDDLLPDGGAVKTPPMAFATNADAMNYALSDLRINHRFYIERYLQWQE